jgi:hypothetical protein
MEETKLISKTNKEIQHIVDQTELYGYLEHGAIEAVRRIVRDSGISPESIEKACPGLRGLTSFMRNDGAQKAQGKK